MTGVNKAIVIGHLGHDPSCRKSTAGAPIVSFSLATSETWRDKGSGERKERTEWHNVVVFDETLCDVAQKFLKKGSKVYVEGKMRTRKYEGKDKIERRTTEIVLESFRGTLTLLDARGDRPPPADDAGAYGSTSAREPAGAMAGVDDDIPF